MHKARKKKEKKSRRDRWRPSPILLTWILLACIKSAHEYEAHAGRAETTATHIPAAHAFSAPVPSVFAY